MQSGSRHSSDAFDSCDFNCSFPISQISSIDVFVSEVFRVSDLNLRIRLHPWNGSGPFKDVAVFFDFDDSFSMSRFIFQFTITILNRKDEMLSISMDDSKLLSSNSDCTDIGFLHFMTSNLLLDPTAGYLDNGEISVSAHVSVTVLPPPSDTHRPPPTPASSAILAGSAIRAPVAPDPSADSIVVLVAGMAELRAAALSSELDEISVPRTTKAVPRPSTLSSFPAPLRQHVLAAGTPHLAAPASPRPARRMRTRSPPARLTVPRGRLTASRGPASTRRPAPA